MRRARPSRAEIAAALRYYEHLRPDGEPPKKTAAGPDETAAARTSTTGEDDQHSTDHQGARERFRQARLLYAAAIVAVMARLPFAAEQVADALAALNRARAELAQLGEGR